MSDPLATDLRVISFFLADHATAVEGKVYASGAFWNQLSAATFPSSHNFAVTAVFEVPWGARDQTHPISVSFVDADSHPIAPTLEGELAVGHADDASFGDAALAPLVVLVNGFTIPHEGNYVAVLSVNGNESARYPFRAHTLVVPTQG